jgi:hypothetical protein
LLALALYKLVQV